jgi:dolichol-phosphate mannosyltransferase
MTARDPSPSPAPPGGGAGRRWAEGPVWVVVPTYDEADNVVPLSRAVLAALDGAGVAGRVLVVDDGSPDGTADLAEALSREEPRVAVMRRPLKQGIGPAYRDGFRRALAEGAALVVEMDCDFSHDPARLPALVAAAAGADLVLGSRYVPGGGVARWGPLRRAVSRGGCLYAQLILGVPVRDLTGGFKCFRREVLEAIPLDEVTAAGYGFQIEMTYRALMAGFRVVEVPITFTERERGRSKMSRGIVWEAAALVPRLRRRLRRQSGLERRDGVGRAQLVERDGGGAPEVPGRVE